MRNFVPRVLPGRSPEYKALMARLRREEEARAYERMLNPTPTLETFRSAFPTPVAAAFAEVNKQLMLVFNFLVSIVGVAATIWIAARWWSVTARVLVTLAGALIVAVAEVAVYSSYMWRMEQGAGKEVKVQEVREVVNTWVLGKDGEGDGDGGGQEESGAGEAKLVGKETVIEETNVRRRNKPKS
ncbi:unnamed protein product [Parascedosporium putredinis]|uniref:Uncharacterized protein n=1 Tax=Parascedosporium putredinis TaxID=1442378 RepID=A0A9P1MDP8_9PEZI|nr:unnamed protein product [Parascedosporium putredinis]CAI8000032.1 unnamed protein product [Parascedosporium putredinis]